MVEGLSDKKDVEKIIRSLPPKYDRVVAAIEKSMDLTLLFFDELFRSLQSHEERLNRSRENSVENAFHTKMNLSQEKDNESKGDSCSRNFAPRGCGG